jgi:hypothetical protein
MKRALLTLIAFAVLATAQVNITVTGPVSDPVVGTSGKLIITSPYRACAGSSTPLPQSSASYAFVATAFTTAPTLRADCYPASGGVGSPLYYTVQWVNTAGVVRAGMDYWLLALTPSTQTVASIYMGTYTLPGSGPVGSLTTVQLQVISGDLKIDSASLVATVKGINGGIVPASSMLKTDVYSRVAAAVPGVDYATPIGGAPSLWPSFAAVATSGRYADLLGIPGSFLPSAHAASHAAGGSDPVSLSESQINGLVADLAAKVPAASPTFTGTVKVPVTGASPQCVYADTDGTLRGSGNLCGVGGGSSGGSSVFSWVTTTTNTTATAGGGYNVTVPGVNVTLPAAPPAGTQVAFYDSLASGTFTVTPGSGDTIVGASSLTEDVLHIGFTVTYMSATHDWGVLASESIVATTVAASATSFYLVANGTGAPANSVNLGLLSSGLLKMVVSGGTAAFSTAAAGTDYQAPLTTGTTAQYFRGDFSLATFPTIPNTASQVSAIADFLANGIPYRTALGTARAAAQADIQALLGNYAISINGQTGAISLGLGTSGTAPGWSLGTLNIPMASAAGVTAGLLSYSDYSSRWMQTFAWPANGSLIKMTAGAPAAAVAGADYVAPTGNAATATAFAAAPTQCSAGYAPTGIAANGNASNCTLMGGGGGSVTKWYPAPASVTAVVSNGYRVTTASITLTLPASPADGSLVGVMNYLSSGVFTIAAGSGNTVFGLASVSVDILYAGFTLVYFSATNDWRAI